jgi:hypothetical protein
LLFSLSLPSPILIIVAPRGMNGDDTILRLLGMKEEDKEDEVVASSED